MAGTAAKLSGRNSLRSPLTDTARDADGRHEYVHLINYSGGLTRPFEGIRTIFNIGIRVRTTAASVRALQRGKALPVEQHGDWIHVVLPELAIFEAIEIE